MTTPSSTLSRYRPVVLAFTGVLAAYCTYLVVSNITADSKPPLQRSNAIRRPRRNTAQVPVPGELVEPQQDGLDDDVAETLADDDVPEEGREPGQGYAHTHPSLSLDMLSLNSHASSIKGLLYHIAEEQAKRQAYIHRGTRCDSCGEIPIKGIRWKCINCPDYDLCSTCEQNQSAPHPKTHLFTKIRIPIPTLAQPHQVHSLWYPGDPRRRWPSLDPAIRERLKETYELEDVQVEAWYDQFTCIANVPFENDPCKLNAAIDRRAFNKAMSPDTRPPVSSNFLYERMFNFYDTNGDELIGLNEFVDGLVYLIKPKNRPLARALKGFDVDGDGIVGRQDFLRMLSAKWGVHKFMIQEMLAADEMEVRRNMANDIVASSQPISAAFGAEDVPFGQTRIPDHKALDAFGDVQISGEGVHRNVVLPDETLAYNPGYEVPEMEEDYGNEVLYKVVQEGFNEMLDPLFKTKEEMAILVQETREERRRLRTEIDDFVKQKQAFQEELRAGSELDPLLATAHESYSARNTRAASPSPSPREEPAPAPQRPSQQEMAQEIDLHIRGGVGLIPTDHDTLDSLEAEIHAQPLDQLLAESGYFIASEDEEEEGDDEAGELAAHLPTLRGGYDPPTPDPGSPSPEIADPTLPQNRPVVTPNLSPMHLSPSSPPTPDPPTQSPAGLSPLDTSLDGPPGPPSIARLEYLASLDEEERLIQERGGPGRMSFAEVEEVVRAGRERGSLELVGVVESWLEWASF